MQTRTLLVLLAVLLSKRVLAQAPPSPAATPAMYYSDSSRTGKPFVKDPDCTFSMIPQIRCSAPTNMPWSVGRAIDADVYLDDVTEKVFLYFATRDPRMKSQMICMAKADLSFSFGAGTWTMSASLDRC